MNLLQMVQRTIRKSGAKVDEPSTVVGAEGITALFVDWVVEAWKTIQLERMGWYWRVDRDRTMSTVIDQEEYSMPSGLEGINVRTLSVYEVVTNERLLNYITYDEWRRIRSINATATTMPLHFTLTPSNTIVLYPAPDKVYTLRYDGILSIEELDDTDDTDSPSNLPTQYHDAIIWQAIMSYAMHFEDGAKLQEAVDRFKPYKKYFEERYMPDVSIDCGSMYRRYIY